MNFPLNAIANVTTLAATAAFLAACGGSSSTPAPPPVVPAGYKTLDAKPPLVLAHRGASGYFPEHTLEAYALAIAMGADVIEPDLVMTKDGVLVSRHDVTLGATSNVADRPEFASRKRAGENGDGEPIAADWFVSDFTLAEIKTLRARSPNHEAAKRNNDQFLIPTFQEILDLIKLKAKETGRTVGVYPETKNPSYHLALQKPGKSRHAWKIA